MNSKCVYNSNLIAFDTDSKFKALITTCIKYIEQEKKL